ncbi:MAG: tRNA dihydrouridine synthase DusB [Candidatus Omnitrophica bacterium]|nr:tRNA dihydrouridine synthase DusB [Candidatus Omnitrophota bacterium]
MFTPLEKFSNNNPESSSYRVSLTGLTLGNVRLSSRCILAPMAGITSLPFRVINRSYGCGCAFLEMINARSLSYLSRQTREMLRTDDRDRPLGIQLLGSEPRFLLKALERLKEYPFDMLDFNAGCPKKKVLARGEGADLLKEPGRLRELLRLLVRHSHVPVTVKIRSGWDSPEGLGDLVRSLEDTGISAITVHGRTAVQGFRGRVDYRAIKTVKGAVAVPVIASGDIFSAQMAKKMFDETGCDAVMVARGAWGNPWIFTQIHAVLEGSAEPALPDIEEVVGVLKEHFRSCLAFYGAARGVVRFRKFYIWYTRGFSHVRSLRSAVKYAKNESEMMDLIEQFRLTGCRQTCCKKME